MLDVLGQGDRSPRRNRRRGMSKGSKRRPEAKAGNFDKGDDLVRWKGRGRKAIEAAGKRKKGGKA